MFKKFLTISLIAGASLALPVQAEDRALLIGVGKYQNPEFNLPGIDLDINMMQKAAKLLGFDNIKTILDEQTTLSNVTKTMEDYLINGVSSNDRVLIYFSGHGTHIPDESGDEADKVDEVLTMHDLKRATIAGKPSLKGVLVDDELNDILKKIPSKNILLLLDACNSGTATKGITLSRGTLGEDLPTIPKTIQYEGMSVVSSKGNFMTQAKSQNDNYVAISAAGDTESAQATSKGSLFTLGILAAINQSAIDSSTLTANTLKTYSTNFIKLENTKAPFTPRLSGNTQLADKAIKIRASNNGYGETWKKLTQLVSNVAPLDIKINKNNYASGDQLKVTINNNQSGYLSVISVDPKDQTTILFPNKHHSDSKVHGTITIPTEQMKFELDIRAPYGETLIVAFLTEKPLSLYKDGNGMRENKGVLDSREVVGNKLHTLSELSLQKTTRAFGVKAKKSSKSRAGKIVTLTCESKCN